MILDLIFAYAALPANVSIDPYPRQDLAKKKHHVWLIDTSGSAYLRGYLSDKRYGRTLRFGFNSLGVSETYTLISYDGRVRILQSKGIPGATSNKMYEVVREDLNKRIRAYSQMNFNPSTAKTKAREALGTDLYGALMKLNDDLSSCGAGSVTISFLTDGSWDPPTGSRSSAAKKIKLLLSQIANHKSVRSIELYGLTDDVAVVGREGGKSAWLGWLRRCNKVKDLQWKESEEP